jgi:D-hydroxyproline dehydrogenase subunit gamma
MRERRSMANPESFLIDLNGRSTRVNAGMTVAAAILEAGAASRLSVRGEPRQPLCGMGICYECRASIDGQAHQRTCQILCRPGMTVIAG